MELALDLGDREREADVLEKLAEVLWGVWTHARDAATCWRQQPTSIGQAGNPDKYAWVVAHMPGTVLNMMRQPEVDSEARLQSASHHLVRLAGVTRIEVTQGRCQRRRGA